MPYAGGMRERLEHLWKSWMKIDDECRHLERETGHGFQGIGCVWHESENACEGFLEMY